MTPALLEQEKASVQQRSSVQGQKTLLATILAWLCAPFQWLGDMSFSSRPRSTVHLLMQGLRLFQPETHQMFDDSDA